MHSLNVITPFQFENHHIRVITDERGEPLFVGKDICIALGYADPTNAMKQHCKGVVKRHPLQTAGGIQEMRVIGEADMFRLIVHSSLPSAEAFEHLVFEEILPAIRRTGSYHQRPAKPTSETKAFKLVPIAVRAALALGLDKNAAAISANQAVTKLTGTNVLQLLGHTHLEAEQQIMFFTPTQLGERINTSARKFNLYLAEAGLQAKQGDTWAPLPAAEGFYRLFDTMKRHSDGAPVMQIKWAENVLALIHQAA